MIPWPVSQRALHDRRLRFRDHRLDHASIFPFFDDQGNVQSLMLTNASDSRIVYIDRRPGLFTRRPFLAPLLDGRFADQNDLATESAERQADLWHFDPWWVLDHPRYTGHGAVPHLHRTNVVGFDKSVKRVWFTADLQRVSMVGIQEGDGLAVKRFAPALLQIAVRERGRSTPRPGSHRRSAWRLSPIWERP